MLLLETRSGVKCGRSHQAGSLGARSAICNVHTASQLPSALVSWQGWLYWLCHALLPAGLLQEGVRYLVTFLP